MASADLASRYDAVLYPSAAFARSHPDRLAAFAHVHGVDAPDPRTARVLELGCAGGGNLVPMAVEAVDATFVGIDLSTAQIEAAREQAAAVGARNVRFEVADLEDFTDDVGFDYILGHGIYSWVSPDKRAALWQTASRLLRPGGVLYLSYNTLPGWHVRGALREMMTYHTARISDPRMAVDQSRALLQFLTTHVPTEDDPWGQWLVRARKHLDKSDDAFVFHDLLEPDNHAFAITTVIDEAATHGFTHLGEGDASHWSDWVVNPDVLAALEPFTGSRARRLAAFDLLRDRTFRWSLFCREAASDEPLLDRIEQLFVAPQIDPDERTYSDELQAAVDTVIERRPADVPVADVPLDAGRLLGLCSDGAVELVIRDRGFPTELPERPSVTRLARWQLGRKLKSVTNRRHEHVETDRLDRELMPLVDGSRSRDGIVEAMLERVREGRFRVQAKGADVDEAQVRRAIAGAVGHRLQLYVERALID